MKKKNYLKIASIIEIIYSVFLIIYYIIIKKGLDEKTAYVFLSSINIGISIFLLSKLKNSNDYFRENKIIITIIGIWFLLDSIVSGILCFMYLNSIKTNNKITLPKIELEEMSIKSVLKSIVLIISFFIFMYVIPNKFKNIPDYIIYLCIFVITLIICFNDYKKSFIVFRDNFKVYLKFIIKKYLIMLGLLFIVAVPIALLNNGVTSKNQQQINDLFNMVPLVLAPLVTLYAPIVEESVFRLSISKLIKNKWLFIIISGVVFGYLHIYGNYSNWKEFIFIFEYSLMGICLAKAYKDSNNIFVSISMHFIQNTLALLIMFISNIVM